MNIELKEIDKDTLKVGDWVDSSDGYIVQSRHVIQPFSAYWDGRWWTNDDDYVVDGVIAWMPLPKRYKGE